MEHIRETPRDFPFLYYQRVFIKGYIALNLPVIMAVRSEIANGYVYLRRHTKGLRIRDLDNAFVRGVSGGQPIGLKSNPVRDIHLSNCAAADVRAKGRDQTFTWLYTKNDLPRIINDETFTEFLACVPTKSRDGSPIGSFNLISSYLSNFIDWYRMVTGDISMTGADHWNTHIPMYGHCIEDISTYGDQMIDDIVLDVDPKRFSPLIFHTDLEMNETATVNAASGPLSREQRIAHYLATAQKLPPVHRRFAEILHLAQQTRDWALVALSMYPVFEQYFDAFMQEVDTRIPAFKGFLEKETIKKKRKVIFISDRIEWLPHALVHLGYEAASAKSYIDELRQANKERNKVVHHNKQPTFEDAMTLARILINAVLLCETALGRESAYVVPLQKLDSPQEAS